MHLIDHFYEADDYTTIWFMDKRGAAFFRLYWYHDTPDRLIFDNFSVDKDHRGNGVGTTVMNLVPDIAKELGFDTVSLWCVKDTWLVDWYKKLGYEYLEDYPEENAIWLRKKINDEKN
jgi:GNAT superfamily N-acetyltransferase